MNDSTADTWSVVHAERRQIVADLAKLRDDRWRVREDSVIRSCCEPDARGGLPQES